MNFILKSPGSSEIRRGPGTFPADLSAEASAKVEIPATAKPNHRLRPSFPRTPLSPSSAPLQRRLQNPPAKSKFLAVNQGGSGTILNRRKSEWQFPLSYLFSLTRNIMNICLNPPLMKIGLFSLLASCLEIQAEPETDVRTWTSTAQTEISAKAISLTDGQVTLMTEEGREIKVPLTKLIPADQQLLRNQFKAKLAAVKDLIAPDLEHPLGENVGPIQADDNSSYLLYLPKTLSADVEAPYLFFVSPIGGRERDLGRYSEVAELVGMIVVVSVESKNQTNAFSINHQHTLDCLKHIEKTLSVDKERLFFTGISGGAATSFYNADRIKCAGALPCVGYMPDKKEPKYGDYFYVVGGAKDFNRYSSAFAVTELGDKATHRIYEGGHGAPRNEVWNEGVLWLYTRELYDNREGREIEIARFEERFLSHLENELNQEQPHIAYYLIDHLLNLCQVEGSFKELLLLQQAELETTPTNAAYLQGRKDLSEFSATHYSKLGKGGSSAEHTTDQLKEAAAELFEKHQNTPEIKDLATMLGEPTVKP